MRAGNNELRRSRCFKTETRRGTGSSMGGLPFSMLSPTFFLREGGGRGHPSTRCPLSSLPLRHHAPLFPFFPPAHGRERCLHREGRYSQQTRWLTFHLSSAPTEMKLLCAAPPFDKEERSNSWIFGAAHLSVTPLQSQRCIEEACWSVASNDVPPPPRTGSPVWRCTPA